MNIRVVLFAGALLFVAWLIARFSRTARYPLHDKVVLITGGSRGLGLVLARHLCARGSNVAIIARDPDELMRAKTDLVPRGGKVLTIECDLLDAGQIESAVQKIIDRFGKIDVLINNAGVIEVGPLEHMTREDFERAMGVHFWGPFELTMRVVPEMRIWGGGRIINVSSIGGKIAVPHLAPYCASKFALTGFSDALRAELARDQIYVTTVAPGMMRIGSHVNANFKGKHDAEFAWFATSNGMPLISINADRAARKILAACRRGQPSLTLTFAARGAAGDEGNESRAGSETRRLVPGWLTRLTDRATARNNENRVEQQAK